MDKLALALVLFSGLFHVMRDLFVKKAVNKELFIGLYLMTGLALSLPYAVFFLTKESFTILNGGVVLVSGAIHALYLIVLAKAYSAGDLSHVYPIIRSAPLLVLLFAILFLEESVSGRGVLGIIAITIGVYMINAKALTLKALLEPFRSIRKEAASKLALLGMFIVATYSLVDKVGVSFFHPISYFFLLQCVSFMCLSPYLLRIKTVNQFKLEWKENRINIIQGAILDVLSYTLVLAALKIAPVSYVVSMRQYSVILAVILGHKLLQERYLKVRMTATMIIFVGILLIFSA